MSESTGEYQHPMHRALPTLLLVTSREQPVVGEGDLTRAASMPLCRAHFGVVLVCRAYVVKQSIPLNARAPLV